MSAATAAALVGMIQSLPGKMCLGGKFVQKLFVFSLFGDSQAEKSPRFLILKGEFTMVWGVSQVRETTIARSELELPFLVLHDPEDAISPVSGTELLMRLSKSRYKDWLGLVGTGCWFPFLSISYFNGMILKDYNMMFHVDGSTTRSLCRCRVAFMPLTSTRSTSVS